MADDLAIVLGDKREASNRRDGGAKVVHKVCHDRSVLSTERLRDDVPHRFPITGQFAAKIHAPDGRGAR
ncbi:hypothetical protein [Frankia sp. ACN1ag]|uniref:hypothetical protein n=1 Tax=Frankia sp. ACN1ag TaxID=102891 RepID=UPI001F1AF11C|nr:hypothetical protein [Frankia sp. ACN1ag]